MACRLKSLLLFIALSLGYQAQNASLAAVLDKDGEAAAKQATDLFNQGRYEEAAPLYSKLLVDYPSMVIFYRNLGACYYHLRRPEPALSSLGRYLRLRRNIAPDDKAVVDGWIAEMKQLQTNQQDVESAPEIEKSVAATVSPVSPQRTDASAQASAATLPGAPVAALSPGDVAAKPAGVNLATRVASDNAVVGARPFYRTWWFLAGAAAIVVGGALTATLLANRSSGRCDGFDMTCREVR
jgi:tetratricopeptide (TPR) repeat protein